MLLVKLVPLPTLKSLVWDEGKGWQGMGEREARNGGKLTCIVRANSLINSNRIDVTSENFILVKLRPLGDYIRV